MPQVPSKMLIHRADKSKFFVLFLCIGT